MTDAEAADLRKKVALSCRILAMQGLVKETTGHVSARIDDETMFVRGRGAEETALLFTGERDVLRATLDGKVLGEEGPVGLPQEFAIHAQIYKARPEVQCVVHAHPPGILMCGLNDLELKPIFGAFDPSALKIAMQGVPVYPRAITVTTPERGQDLVRTMAGKDCVLMYGHGITAVGSCVEDATVKAIKLETLARINWHATRNGPVRTLSAEDLEYYSDMRAGSGRRSFDPVWRYYVQLLDHQGILSQELVPNV
jgi:ribulose-5-phosphate 4-epimerase/fuculose-1-phosphate aldolase